MALSKQELEVLVQVIDVCTTRGAFKGEELLTMGQIRARLTQEQATFSDLPADEKEKS